MSETGRDLAKVLASWGIDPATNDLNLRRVRSGELVQIWIGCDTGQRQLKEIHAALGHGEKYLQGRGWTRYCVACDKGLHTLQTVEVYFPESNSVGYCVAKKDAYNAVGEVASRIDSERAERKTKILTKAKETGERQVVRKWSENCDGSVEECDVDQCVEWLYPDGHVKITRNHMY